MKEREQNEEIKEQEEINKKDNSNIENEIKKKMN